MPTCAHGLEKINKIPTPISAVLASDWGAARTCNTAEGFWTSAVTHFAAVFRGWQHCLHPITMWGWIQGKSLYLPGFHRQCNDGYFVAVGVKDKYIFLSSGLCIFVLTFDTALSFLSLSNASWKTGEQVNTGYDYLWWLQVHWSVLSAFMCLYVRLCDCDSLCRPSEYSPSVCPAIAQSYSQRKPA